MRTAISCVRPCLPSEYAMNLALVIWPIAAIITCQLFAKKMSTVFLFKETYNLSAVTSDQRSVLPIKLQTIVEQVAGYCCIGDRRRTGFLARMRVDRGRRNRAKPFGRAFGCDARPGASRQGNPASFLYASVRCQ